MSAITPIANDKKETPHRCCPRCGHYFQYRMPRGLPGQIFTVFPAFKQVFLWLLPKEPLCLGAELSEDISPASKRLVQVEEEAFTAEFAPGIIERQVGAGGFVEQYAQAGAVAGLKYLEDLGALLHHWRFAGCRTPRR